MVVSFSKHKFQRTFELVLSVRFNPNIILHSYIVSTMQSTFGVLLGVLLLCCNVSFGMQLLNDRSNPFKAYGNATTFDISSIFNYPVKITGS